MTDQLKTSPFDLDSEILSVYKIPQCLTEGLAPGFIMDVVDFQTIHPEWMILDPGEKQNRVDKALMKMEEENKLTSKVTKVKERHFDDDEETPNLPSRVRVYSMVR
jgi:hypothetical protein